MEDLDNQSIKDRFSTEIDTINHLDSSQVSAIVSAILEFLSSPSSSEDFQETLASLAPATRLNGTTFKAIIKFLMILFQGAIKDTLTESQFQKLLSSLYCNESIIETITTIWISKSNILNRSLVSRALASNKLIDIDWSFGVTASSDDMDQVGKTYLQVKLKIDTGSDGIQDKYVEMTLEQFYTFLAELEKCKSFLDALTAV